MWPNSHFPADFVTFTEEILNGKLDFLGSVREITTLDFINKNEIDKNVKVSETCSDLIRIRSFSGPHIQTESGYLLCISAYSVLIQGNRDQTKLHILTHVTKWQKETVLFPGWIPIFNPLIKKYGPDKILLPCSGTASTFRF